MFKLGFLNIKIGTFKQHKLGSIFNIEIIQLIILKLYALEISKIHAQCPILQIGASSVQVSQ